MNRSRSSGHRWSDLPELPSGIDTFLQALLEGLTGAVAVLGAEGRVVAANTAWKEFAAVEGVDPHQIPGDADYRLVCDCMHSSDQLAARQAEQGVRDVVAGRLPEFRIAYPRHDPEAERWFELCVRRFTWSGQAFVVTKNEPLTERRREEIAAAERGRFLRLALRGSSTGLWSWDLVQNRILASAETFELFGLEPTEESVAMDRFSDRIEPDCWRRIQEKLHREFAIRQIESESEFRVNHPERGVIWVMARGEILYDMDGRPVLLLGIATDITEWKRTEAALQANEARFRQMADNAPVIIWTTDPSGECTYLSKAWHDLTGMEPGKGLGLRWLQKVHPHERGDVHRLFLEANRRQESIRFEYRLRGADGTWRWVIDSAAPWFGEDGTFLGYIGSVVDITERKQAEEQQKLLMAELNHRVKNTLAVVQSIAMQTLRRAASLQSFAESFTGRLQTLAAAHSLLTQSNWRSARLAAIVRKALKAHGTGTESFELSGADLDLSPKQTLDIALVLHELATNAVKHGALSHPAGRVTIRWTLADEGEGRLLHLMWCEADGPQIQAPTAEGFGLKLIRHMVAYDLGGQVIFDFETSGLKCEIVIPWKEPPADQPWTDPGRVDPEGPA